MKTASPDLFLRLQGKISASTGLPLIQAALRAGEISWVLLPQPFCQHNSTPKLEEIIAYCQTKETAVFLTDSPDVAVQCGADGVHLSDDSAFSQLRQTLPAEMMIGVHCGTSRHKAMTIAEAGADYVAFDTAAKMPDGTSLLGWWAEVFTTPCVAFDPVPLDELEDLLTANPDFIAPGIELNGPPEAVGETISTYVKIITAHEKKMTETEK